MLSKILNMWKTYLLLLQKLPFLIGSIFCLHTLLISIKLCLTINWGNIILYFTNFLNFIAKLPNDRLVDGVCNRFNSINVYWMTWAGQFLISMVCSEAKILFGIADSLENGMCLYGLWPHEKEIHELVLISIWSIQY